MSIPTLSEIEQEFARRKYYRYVEYVNRNSGYIHGRFTMFLSNLVQQFLETDTKNAYDILCLSVPPQHSKSETVTKALPSYLMGKYPTERTIIVSYNSDMAELFLQSNRQKLADHLEIFNIEIVKNTQGEVTNKQGGTIFARGILSGITGLPAKYVIIDDPVKNQEEADSPTMREKMYRAWLSEIKSRLAPGAKVIVIQTRWHQQDLTGMLIENEPNVKVINLPVVCETETDIIGRKFGETLNPEIGKDRAWWDSFKQSFNNKYGSRTMNALYFGRPSNDEGGLFKRGWFKQYIDAPRIEYLCISLDATFKNGDTSDFVAIQVWAKSGTNYYLLHKVKERLSFTETLARMNDVIRLYPEYDEIAIEDKANGTAIIEVLRKTYSRVVSVEPYGSKQSRASAISPLLEAGNVFIKPDHSSLIDEAVDFPNSDHDDEVDAMSQALNRMRNINPQSYEKQEIYEYEDEINKVLGYW